MSVVTVETLHYEKNWNVILTAADSKKAELDFSQMFMMKKNILMNYNITIFAWKQARFHTHKLKDVDFLD